MKLIYSFLYKTCFIAVLMTTCKSASAQQPTLFCGFDQAMKMKRKNDPAFYSSYSSLFEKWQASKDNRGGGSGVYTLPVVFHIVYHSANENLPDSVVHSQIEVLNEDFRRLNADAINTREIFQPFAADCQIEFALASIDPEGNPTTGIIHTYTDRTDFTLDISSDVNTLDEVKHTETGGSEAWDPSHYINVWVCHIGILNIGQIYGFSYPPAGLPNWPSSIGPLVQEDDGIIVHYTTPGRNNPSANEDGHEFNNSGRTLTHEMGHYLGLRHTWGDDSFVDNCSGEDGMDDTPVCGSGDSFACFYGANTCDDGSSNDLPDMIENYMDYTQDACYNMFTNDQASFMRFVIENSRSALLTSNGITTRSKDVNSILIWPNPVSNILYFSKDLSSEKYSFLIQNSLGQNLIFGSTFSNTISISSLEPGNYILHLTKYDGNTTIRFVVI